jgi:gamma-D-glutamyl-L-lysine dipeptidyl-peptidase
MLYSQIGVDLPRDSKQQINDHRFKAIEIDELDVGDLIFFGKSAEKIRHVGLYIGEGRFIHPTVLENKPWLRISRLTDFQWSGDEGATYPYRTARQLKVD